MTIILLCGFGFVIHLLVQHGINAKQASGIIMQDSLISGPIEPESCTTAPTIMAAGGTEGLPTACIEHID